MAEQKLSVAIDARTIVEQPGGIGVYVENLVSHLSNNVKLKIFLFCYKSTPKSNLENITWVELPRGPLFYVYALRKIKSLKIEIFHSPFSGILPLILGRKAIITVHDLVPEIFPKTSTLPSRISFSITRLAAKRVGSIISVSNSTKADIESNWKISTPIFVTRLGVNRLREKSEKNFKPQSKGYFLSVSTLEPRKNLRTLILAYLAAKGKNKDFPDLYICGGSGWKGEKEKLYQIASPSNGAIKFQGYVPDGELSILMSNCKAFFFPSFYEGVGLPPMEAALEGAPIFCSKIPSLLEILNDVAYFINPNDLKSWTKAFNLAFSNPDLLLELSSKSGNFTPIDFSETAESTSEVYYFTKRNQKTN